MSQKKSHATASATLTDNLPTKAVEQKAIASTAPQTMITTSNFNRACFFLSMGGTLLEMTGKFTQYTYLIRISPWLLWYEKSIGLVDYRQYIDQRIKLKLQQRKESGLPLNFTGKSSGFEFGDIATFKSDKDVERWKKLIKSIKKEAKKE